MSDTGHTGPAGDRATIEARPPDRPWSCVGGVDGLSVPPVPCLFSVCGVSPEMGKGRTGRGTSGKRKKGTMVPMVPIGPPSPATSVPRRAFAPPPGHRPDLPDGTEPGRAEWRSTSLACLSPRHERCIRLTFGIGVASSKRRARRGERPEGALPSGGDGSGSLSEDPSFHLPNYPPSYVTLDQLGPILTRSDRQCYTPCHGRSPTRLSIPVC